MRVLAAVLIASSLATDAFAQNTFDTWTIAGTTCGVRNVGGHKERFVAVQTGSGLSYDFSPSDEKWHSELCDRDPLAPAPSFEELYAEAKRAADVDCDELARRRAQLPPAERREVEGIMARYPGKFLCRRSGQ